MVPVDWLWRHHHLEEPGGGRVNDPSAKCVSLVNDLLPCSLEAVQINIEWKLQGVDSHICPRLLVSEGNKTFL